MSDGGQFAIAGQAFVQSFCCVCFKMHFKGVREGRGLIQDYGLRKEMVIV